MTIFTKKHQKNDFDGSVHVKSISLRKIGKGENQMKKEKGITLIAMVITIIVLLILAGVTLKMVIGEQGILKRTSMAVDKNSEETAREKLNLELQALRMDKVSEANYNSGAYIDQKLEEQGFIVIEDTVIVNGYQFVIDREEVKILYSLGKGVENEEIKINAMTQLSEDRGKCTIVVTIDYSGEIDSVLIDSREVEAENGSYMLEVTRNGTYTIFVKDTQNGYKMQTVEVTGMLGYIDEIWTIADLEQFQDGVNSGLNYEGRTVTLEADLDLAEIENFEPIGYYSNETDHTSFKGTFDGKEHVIRNLKMNVEANSGVYWGVGFFGCLENAMLKNLSFENVAIVSEVEFTGVAVGGADDCCTLENIKILSGELVGTREYLGGVAGECVRNCEKLLKYGNG